MFLSDLPQEATYILTDPTTDIAAKIDKLAELASNLKDQVAAIDKTEVTHQAQASKERNAKLLATRQKLATKSVLDPPGDRTMGDLTVLEEPNVGPTAEPDRVKGVIESYYRKLMAPP